MLQLRRLREAAGLTQSDLAGMAGVSRQLVGAVEAGRHLPRVDAALSLAAALGVDVEALFGRRQAIADILTGDIPADGSLVRATNVGDVTVTAAARLGTDGYDIADGVVEDGILRGLVSLAPGIVVAGCEPGLELLERVLRERGMGAVSVSSSSAVALEALSAGRAHAAVVHGSVDRLASLSSRFDGVRIRLVGWNVGLSAPADAAAGWDDLALSGRVPVIQREQGAGVQQTFELAVSQDAVTPVPGPKVGGHLEAARRSVISGMAAVTIEPAALAVGARFRALDVHRAELWVGRRWERDRGVAEAVDVIVGHRFQTRLAAVGGYDLTGCGDRAA
jgi:transcriptional regulator with XRE-family HTH domain